MGQIVEIQCQRLGVEGKGICHIEDSSFVILCKALPGEKLVAKISSMHRQHGEAIVIERLQRNRNYVDPACTAFGSCGGCSLQSMGYASQLQEKQSLVAETLKRGKIRSIEQAEFFPIVPSPLEYGYRNKITLFWALDEDGSPILGMKVRGSSETFPIPHCHLADEATNAMARLIGASASSRCTDNARLLPYGSSPSGIMKEVVIRSWSVGEGVGPREYLIILVTSSDEPQSLGPIVEDIMASPLSTVVVGILNRVVPHSSNNEEEVEDKESSKTRAPKGYWRFQKEDEAATALHLLYGRDHLIDYLCGLLFKVSAESFAQVNPQQCENLYERIKKVADLRSTDTLLDLYCGTGTIGLTMARSVKSLIGIEWNEAALACARSNAALNGIDNATFIAGDCGKILKKWSDGIRAQDMASRSRIVLSNPEKIPRPNVVILDPARAGCSSGVLSYLEACGCRRIVYVSCSPATATRDLALLCGTSKSADGASKSVASVAAGGRFALKSVQPFDMFPQTDHCELIAVLDRVE